MQPNHVEIEDVDQIEAIEASIACLPEVLPMANDEIGPIERLYDLRTRMSNGKEVAQDSWKANLVNTLHMAYVMGWETLGHEVRSTSLHCPR